MNFDVNFLRNKWEEEKMVIFLDIDGVLNCASDWKRPFTINPDCLYEFKKLLSLDGQNHIILTSTWKNSFDISFFSKYGITVKDVTKTVPGKTRQEEVEYYIKRHGIKDYVILDDDISLYPNPKELNLYIVNYKTGFTENDFKKLKRLIKK